MTTRIHEKIDPITNRALILLSIAFFMQATTAMSVVGAFGAIASEWHLSTTDIAMLVTAFGATFAVTAPVLQILVGHWIRRTQILFGLSVMALGALLFAWAPNYEVLFISRIIAGLGAALISPVLSALGASLVKPAQQGGALATVIMGYSVATVIGVPASSWLSLHLGARGFYVVLAAATFFTAALIGFLIKDRTGGGKVSPAQLKDLMKRPATLSGLLVVFFISSGIFGTYTVITPIFRDLFGASPQMISAALLL
ncbi:MFS transporter [bacterium]|nr:MAG: MFS transporter [bacterium]